MTDRNDIFGVNPSECAPPGGHYAHAVRAGGVVYVSGQLPVAGDGRRLVDEPFADQARQVLNNVAAALRAAGSSTDRIVQVRVYVTDIGDWPAFNTVYAEWIGAHRPARCVVPVPALHHGFKIEVECTALT
jgi:reactive intermediate/imine deaminase